MPQGCMLGIDRTRVPLHQKAKAESTITCQGHWAPREGTTSYWFPGIYNPRSWVMWHPQECNQQRFPPKLREVIENLWSIIFGFPKSMKNDRTHAIRRNTGLEQVFPW